MTTGGDSPTPVRLARGDGLLTVTLNRAQKGNALSPDLVQALHLALDDAVADPEVHTLLFVGEGKHLCTGFDLAGLESLSEGDLLLRFVRIEALLQALWQAPLRTAAIASGSTWGAGADLFAACEVRLVRAGARLRFPGAGFGLVLGTRRLVERVGAGQARHWLLGSEIIPAQQALESGLATGRLDADERVPASLVQPPAITGRTAATLRRLSRTDNADADLADLVRSAAEPGLKDRIAAYRQRG
jgi:enoyl-CoA hydratase/carnithine racemase